MNFLRFKSRLKQLTFWIAHGKYHLLSGAAYIFTAFYLTGFLNFYPKTVALLMTLIGLFIILRQQISEANKFSEHKANTFMNWIKSFPTGKPITLSVDDIVSVSEVGKADLTTSIATDATIEEKVVFLLRQVTALKSTIAKIDDRIDRVNSSMNKNKNEFQTSLDTLRISLNTIIAGHVVGAYDVNLFGIILTICGTVIQFSFS